MISPGAQKAAAKMRCGSAAPAMMLEPSSGCATRTRQGAVGGRGGAAAAASASLAFFFLEPLTVGKMAAVSRRHTLTTPAAVSASREYSVSGLAVWPAVLPAALGLSSKQTCTTVVSRASVCTQGSTASSASEAGATRHSDTCRSLADDAASRSSGDAQRHVTLPAWPGTLPRRFHVSRRTRRIAVLASSTCSAVEVGTMRCTAA
mmetsp:Transcript_42127/g.84581  ORF Transcript_42127/g.84581 Transcript_42127/m.84581 type:complete len:205 (-) Transcript_42127:86-700(-)